MNVNFNGQDNSNQQTVALAIGTTMLIVVTLQVYFTVNFWYRTWIYFYIENEQKTSLNNYLIKLIAKLN